MPTTGMSAPKNARVANSTGNGPPAISSTTKTKTALIAANATCPATVIEAVAAPDAEGAALIRSAAESMRLSARGFHRTLRVARTLADLDGEAQVRRLHLAEALSYRGRGDSAAAAA